MPAKRNLDDWEEPPDFEKPELPYRNNSVLSIRRHIPPEPFGTLYTQETWRKEVDKHDLYDMTQSELCLQHPPAETAPHSDQTVSSLRVVEEIACRDGRGAQVLRCQLNDNNGQDYVAKIYDPLYYKYGPDVPNDVTWKAESEYSQEAAAYEELVKNEVAGVYTPKYYGSWTFEMPLEGEANKVRSVRMILLGWIEGVTMKSLIETKRIRKISPNQRLEILAKAMEIECKVSFHGVWHRDLAPRNLLLVGSDVGNEIPDIYLFDFSIAAVFSHPNCAERNYDTPRPISPRYQYWGQCPEEFHDWVPEPHRSRPLVFKGWVKTRWPQMEEFSDAPEGLQRFIDFHGPVEFASPEW
ncbi:hypothetical protein PT974_03581 [Cladobotryum mycophilum]|uniref:EKC/KEOPS complex subunit BUD32 n=1 Tax=Cladobotryum mycophilum TaxID=491253 RepID=A0ABR0SSQ0_9HYPO